MDRRRVNVRFTKMHGLGNDFVVLDALTQSLHVNQRMVRFLADRHRGVGCDQVLVVEPPSNPENDFRYRIFNQDGSEVEQCGNGARCFAKFVRDHRLSAKRRLQVETLGGVISLSYARGNLITVGMGVPRLEPAEIPFEADSREAVYTVEVGGEQIELSAVSMGNPHAVMVVDDVSSAPVQRLGPLLESHPRFPNRVNVGFMQVVNRQEARLRVFERGVGETRACGSGACAAMVAGRLRGLFDEQVKIHLPGGYLQIEWSGADAQLLMTGPATTVFEGQIQL